MGKYISLRQNPPKLSVKENAREVTIKTISCMCDNVHYLTLKKNSEGDFMLYGNGRTYCSWQIKYPVHDIEWAADEGDWNRVFEMINTGTSVISEIKSR